MRPRTLRITDAIAVVPLTQGKEALIDAEDAERIGRYNWMYSGNGYAQRGATVDEPTRFMHRMIVAAPAGTVVDHINGNTLDNRKSNLRVTTQSVNGANRRKLSRRNSSGFRGVSWDSRRQNYRAQIKVNYEFINLGRYTKPQDAARAYDKAARQHFGDAAVTNEDLGLLAPA